MSGDGMQMIFSDMMIKNEFPPNYVDILTAIPEVKNGTPIFCYGDTIYNPHSVTITPDLEVHEAVHQRQQADSPDVWWFKYLNDSHFRLKQEIEAYETQYAFCKQHMNGKLLEWGLDKMAEALSGELYGNLLSYGEARSKIRNFTRSQV